MDEVFKNLIDQAPWAAALLVLVVIFVRYLSKRDTDHNDTVKRIVAAHDARIGTMVGDFTSHSEQCATVQQESIKATERNTVLLEDLRTVCRDLNTSISTCQQAQTLWKETLQKGSGKA